MLVLSLTRARLTRATAAAAGRGGRLGDEVSAAKTPEVGLSFRRDLRNCQARGGHPDAPARPLRRRRAAARDRPWHLGGGAKRQQQQRGYLPRLPAAPAGAGPGVRGGGSALGRWRA